LLKLVYIMVKSLESLSKGDSGGGSGDSPNPDHNHKSLTGDRTDSELATNYQLNQEN